jgi:hypothetical protein
VDATAGQLVESRGDFADGASEPIYGDDHEVIAFTEVTYALRPAGSVATSATGRGVGEDPLGGDASRRDGVMLLTSRANGTKFGRPRLTTQPARDMADQWAEIAGWWPVGTRVRASFNHHPGVTRHLREPGRSLGAI